MSGTNAAVVVGSSVAGIRTAQALCSAGYDGEVLVLGEETVVPYDRPPLSKAVLVGAADAADAPLLRAGSEFTVRLGARVVAVDVAAAEVELADGERVGYRELVVATGAVPRQAPWGRPAGTHELRTAADATALRADLARGGPLVVVGAGMIGSEVAASARTLGIEVTLVDPLPAPAVRVVGAPAGALLADLHRGHGVALHLGVGVSAIERGRVTLTDGTVLPASAVVVGIGTAPATDWLADSGLRLHDGLVCDPSGRCVPGVWAVGDVARWTHPGGSARYEHWTAATDQAALVGRNIARGERTAYVPREYVWSDQYDWKLQVAGRPAAAVDHTVIGDPADGVFAVVGTDPHGLPTGVVAVNWPRAMLTARRFPDAPDLVGRITDALGARS
ncbi:MAG: FAD-dependent oxidoreductase [Actinophytocola sp.]|uniref:NAD(P)/FAD-dependent oxidoreductase n=1 Tax=Actinophytocola sp. TaxID=1872138 RepID=UPI003C71CEBC